MIHPSIIAYGENALLIQFDQRIDVEVLTQVTRWKQTVETADLDGVTYLIPAYASLTIGFDPLNTSFEILKNRITELTLLDVADLPIPKKYLIPVCYDPGFALDMQDICAHTGLTPDAVIDHHTTARLQVFMIGFLPGFAYLGSLPATLSIPRMRTPRPRVPALSVAIAGLQTAVYPCAAPGGWRIIGRTPIPMLRNTESQFALLEPGNCVRFYPISMDEYSRTLDQIEAGNFDYENLLAG